MVVGCNMRLLPVHPNSSPAAFGVCSIHIPHPPLTLALDYNTEKRTHRTWEQALTSLHLPDKNPRGRVGKIWSKVPQDWNPRAGRKSQTCRQTGNEKCTPNRLAEARPAFPQPLPISLAFQECVYVFFSTMKLTLAKSESPYFNKMSSSCDKLPPLPPG